MLENNQSNKSISLSLIFSFIFRKLRLRQKKYFLIKKRVTLESCKRNACRFIKKDTITKAFFYESGNSFKNKLFIGPIRMAASETVKQPRKFSPG